MPYFKSYSSLLCLALLCSVFNLQAQNVGIGTVSPSSALDVANANLGLTLRAGNVFNANTNSQVLFGFNGDSTYRHRIVSRHNALAESGNAIDFYVWTPASASSDPTEIGSVHTLSLNGGNVGVGLTNP